MADTKGTDPKPADGKTGDTKPAAVRPPVLDLKAREAGSGGKPEDKPKPAPAAKPAETSRPVEKPPAPAQGGGFAFGAAIAGGVLGLAAAYGLAATGLWPTAPVATPPADARLAQFAAAINELETVTQTTQSELAALNQRVGDLENAEPTTASDAATPVNLGSIESDIAALTQRMDAMSTQPAAAADNGAADALRADLAALGARLDELSARVGTAEAGLRDLDTTVTQTSVTLAGQPSDIGAVLQLPLILSGFETAFATGRPYETELAALRAASPAATIPTGIANAAATGLARPDAIARRFDEVLPAILAGRPANPDAQWQDGAMDWFRGMIALRPTGEIEGDTPEAVVSRLEGAIARRDFTTAETLLAALPPPMLAAADDVPALVATQAEAARFLETLRSEALSGEVSP